MASEMPRIGAASRPGWFSNTKRYIQEDLIPTLPSYKHPEFIHSSNIGIVFDLNVYTRAHFSLRAQITSNSNFYRYVTRTIYSCLFSTDEEAAASKRLVIYAFSAQINLLPNLPHQTTFAQHSSHLVSHVHVTELVERLNVWLWALNARTFWLLETFTRRSSNLTWGL